MNKMMVCVVFLSQNIFSTPRMAVYEYFIDLLSADLHATEYKAYQALKKNPIKFDTNYVAMPWRYFLKQKKLHNISKIKVGGGFTICQSIHFERIIPFLVNIGIDTLFATHAKIGAKYDGVNVLPFPHSAINGIKPAAHKDILYSFIGANTKKGLRGKIFSMPTLKDCVIIKRLKRSYDQSDKDEYKDILSRSRYSLCPRGTGPNSIRFWKSLQAGAIPILLADDLALPNGIDWDSCIIRVKEADLLSINDIVQNISLEQEQLMRSLCLKAYALFSGKNLISCIREYYESY